MSSSSLTDQPIFCQWHLLKDEARRHLHSQHAGAYPIDSRVSSSHSKRKQSRMCSSSFWSDLDVQLSSCPSEICFLYSPSASSHAASKPPQQFRVVSHTAAPSALPSFLCLLYLMQPWGELTLQPSFQTQKGWKYPGKCIQANPGLCTSPGRRSDAKGLPETGWSISLFPVLNLVRIFYRQLSIEMSAALSTHPLPCT